MRRYRIVIEVDVMPALQLSGELVPRHSEEDAVRTVAQHAFVQLEALQDDFNLSYQNQSYKVEYVEDV